MVRNMDEWYGRVRERRKSGGWYDEPQRHRLAAKGIETTSRRSLSEVSRETGLRRRIQMSRSADRAAGGGLSGYMPNGISYFDLVDIFGEMNGKPGMDNKAEYKWVGFLDGKPFEIYNYCTGHKFDPREGKDPEELYGRDWHIRSDSETTHEIRKILAGHASVEMDNELRL